MFIRLSFVTLIFAVAALGTPVKRDAAKVRQDIQELDQKSLALDLSVNAFPSSGGTPIQVENIHAAAKKLDDFIKFATSDVNASDDFTVDEANGMLESIEDELAPDVKKGLDDLVAKKPAVSALHVDFIAESDLQALKNDTVAFMNALIAKAPAQLKGKFEDQRNAMESEFDHAINVYST